jgi:hypothetical protein
MAISCRLRHMLGACLVPCVHQAGLLFTYNKGSASFRTINVSFAKVGPPCQLTLDTERRPSIPLLSLPAAAVEELAHLFQVQLEREMTILGRQRSAHQAQCTALVAGRVFRSTMLPLLDGMAALLRLEQPSATLSDVCQNLGRQLQRWHLPACRSVILDSLVPRKRRRQRRDNSSRIGCLTSPPPALHTQERVALAHILLKASAGGDDSCLAPQARVPGAMSLPHTHEQLPYVAAVPQASAYLPATPCTQPAGAVPPRAGNAPVDTCGDTCHAVARAAAGTSHLLQPSTPSCAVRPFPSPCAVQHQAPALAWPAPAVSQSLGAAAGTDSRGANAALRSRPLQAQHRPAPHTAGVHAGTHTRAIATEAPPATPCAVEGATTAPPQCAAPSLEPFPPSRDAATSRDAAAVLRWLSTSWNKGAAVAADAAVASAAEEAMAR